MRGSTRCSSLAIAVLTWLMVAVAPGALFAQPQVVPGATYIGAKACEDCHEEEVEKFAATKMGHIFLDAPRDEREKLACENCHGPGSEHAKHEKKPGLILSFGKGSQFSIEQQNEACVQCHDKGLQTFWKGSVHEVKDLACVDCHVVMHKTETPAQLAAVEEKTAFYARRAETEVCLKCHLQRAAQLMRSSHMPVREGKMTCVDCHNPHGSLAPALLKANSVNEMCYTCHANRRGPFLWEHPPVRENCLNCHEAHGSIHANLLKAKVPRLCQQCHIETRHPTQPHRANDMFVLNRSCTNCHSQIHGSNHPSGVRFMR